MASALPSFPSFDVGGNPTSLGIRWKAWLRRFDNLIVAMDIDDEKRKRALLLHYAGPDVHEIFQTLSDTGNSDNYVQAVARLNEYFSPKKNTDFELWCSVKPSKTLEKLWMHFRQGSVNL